MPRLPLFFVALSAVLLVTPDALAQYYGPVSMAEEITWRLIPHLVAGVLGLAIGAFFSPALREFRKGVGLFLLASLFLFAFFGPFPFADLVNWFMTIAVFSVAMYFGLRLGLVAGDSGDPRPTSFGSAQWADLTLLQTAGMLGSDGFTLGEFVDRTPDGQLHRSPLSYSGARHLLTVAPTRSGKGVSSIIPNLLTYQGSVFVIDPKGENALVTARRRGAGGNGISGLMPRQAYRNLLNRLGSDDPQTGAIRHLDINGPD